MPARPMCLAALLSVFALAAPGSVTKAGTPPFKVTSTLDGKTVLPYRTRWLAYPKLPASRVAEVAFLIDGKVRWIEHEAPYTFGEDGGYLITTWLRAGVHRFTTRVTDSRGRRANDNVVARVRAPLSPPGPLGHRWKRTLTSADQDKSGIGDPPPKGHWEIVIDQVGIWELDPHGSGTITQYLARGDRLDVYAPIQLAPDGVGIARYGHSRIGGFECSPSGPFGSYRWSIAGAKLRLAAGKEGCGGRRAILEGTWTRVG